MSTVETAPRSRSPAVLACPFRPFFLLTALYAIVVLAGWLGFLFRYWPVTGGLPPLQWHAHEMLFGVVMAAIAGFLLTAMCNWTGAKPLSGARLAALVALWIAGRIAMWSAQWLPGGLIAAVDLAFPLVLTVYVGRVIVGAGSRRNLVMVAVLALLLMANLMSHLGLWWLDPVWTRRGEMTATFLIVLLMVVIGGRITPLFTANWLERRGWDRRRVRSRPWVDRLALVSTALLVPLVLIPADPAWTAAVALLAGVANGVRLAGWSGWRGLADPLIWVLHLGYAWIVTGLMLKGLAFYLPGVPDSAWIHAIGAGAMGTLIIGVMSRVSLGHTGRSLELPAGASLMYWMITAAAVFRVIASLGWMDVRPALLLSGGFWGLAFVLFLVWYVPVLTGPRVDGRPG